MQSLDKILERIQAKITAKSLQINQENVTSEEKGIYQNSITKSNHLARSYYRFTLTEKRVSEALISLLNPKRNADQSVELNATDYAKAFGVNRKHAYSDMNKAVSSLMSKVISIKTPEGREEYALMAKAQYIDNEGKIICTFNPLVTPHLVGLRARFTKYPMKMIADFASTYTWRIYELLMSWAKDLKITDGIVAGWFKLSVEEMRSSLGIPNGYRWADINTRVLKRAKNEIYEKCKIVIEYEFIKTGKKVTSVKFNFAETKSPN